MRLFFFACALLAASAQAQESWPSRNVRLVAAAAPGGNPDVLGRLLAHKFSGVFGKPFVVENVPGAGARFSMVVPGPVRPVSVPQ